MAITLERSNIYGNIILWLILIAKHNGFPCWLGLALSRHAQSACQLCGSRIALEMSAPKLEPRDKTPALE